VLDVKSKSRVIVDGATSSVYFGAGDGKIYRFQKQ
jgi:hypothetical protein